MANQAIATVETTYRKKTGFQRFVINFKKNWQLHLMILLPLAYIIIFEYLPMYGLQIAFRDYNSAKLEINSEWIGLYQLQKFFRNPRWTMYVTNTLSISIYSILASFPIPIVLALILHINEYPVLKKITQNVSYIPHFISTVVMVGILNQIFAPWTGLIAAIVDLFGGVFNYDIRTDPDAFIHLYVWSGVWQGMGWGAIMYVAALSGVPMELHEAAKIDGASRLRRVFAVDLPAIMPTVCIMLILRFGSIMSVGYEKVYQMQYGPNLLKSEVISTHVYKAGLGDAGNLSYGSAVGLLNSIINTSMVLLMNWITNKLSDGEAGLF